jgi:poly-gamma-glutamate synthesis protein (capsule biosynthesis protein)
MGDPSVVLGLVGDLLVDRDAPDEAFSLAKPALDSCDLLFGNLESVYTDHPHPAPSLGIALFPGRRNLDCFARAGFDVVSMANNHICDAGHEALLDTRAALRRQGVATCGAGASLAEAREPAIVSHNGLSIAFLAYASVFPFGYEARAGIPGLAPLRAYNLVRPPIDNYYVPGMAPRVTTVPDEIDLAHLKEDIAQAKKRADIVVTSFHWGDFLRPFHLTDHERQMARLCIDEGADMVVGHHHHALRGMEWYRGKPILYGLGHFVFDLRLDPSVALPPGTGTELEYGIGPREGWPLLPLHPDTRLTVLAVTTIGKGGVTDVGYLPCRLRPDGLVQAFDATAPEAQAVVDYMAKCNATQKLRGAFVLDERRRLHGMSTMRLEEQRPA